MYEHPAEGNDRIYTDDAMVVEQETGVKDRALQKALISNIKITTPEDLVIAEAFLNCESLGE